MILLKIKRYVMNLPPIGNKLPFSPPSNSEEINTGANSKVKSQWKAFKNINPSGREKIDGAKNQFTLFKGNQFSKRLSDCAYKALSYLAPSKSHLKISQVAIEPPPPEEKPDSSISNVDVKKPTSTKKSHPKSNQVASESSRESKSEDTIVYLSHFKPHVKEPSTPLTTSESSISSRSDSPPISLPEDEPKDFFARNEIKKTDFFKSHPSIQSNFEKWKENHTKMHQSSMKVSRYSNKNQKLVKSGYKERYIQYIRDFSKEQLKGLQPLISEIKELEKTKITDPEELEILNKEIKKLKQLLILEIKEERNLTFANTKQIYEKKKPELEKLNISHLTPWEQICTYYEIEDDEMLKTEWIQFQKDVNNELAKSGIKKSK